MVIKWGPLSYFIFIFPFPGDSFLSLLFSGWISDSSHSCARQEIGIIITPLLRLLPSPPIISFQFAIFFFSATASPLPFVFFMLDRHHQQPFFSSSPSLELEFITASSHLFPASNHHHHRPFVPCCCPVLAISASVAASSLVTQSLLRWSSIPHPQARFFSASSSVEVGDIGWFSV